MEGSSKGCRHLRASAGLGKSVAEANPHHFLFTRQIVQAMMTPARLCIAVVFCAALVFGCIMTETASATNLQERILSKMKGRAHAGLEDQNSMQASLQKKNRAQLLQALESKSKSREKVRLEQEGMKTIEAQAADDLVTPTQDAPTEMTGEEEMTPKTDNSQVPEAQDASTTVNSVRPKVKTNWEEMAERAAEESKIILDSFPQSTTNMPYVSLYQRWENPSPSAVSIEDSVAAFLCWSKNKWHREKCKQVSAVCPRFTGSRRDLRGDILINSHFAQPKKTPSSINKEMLSKITDSIVDLQAREASSQWLVSPSSDAKKIKLELEESVQLINSTVSTGSRRKNSWPGGGFAKEGASLTAATVNEPDAHPLQRTPKDPVLAYISKDNFALGASTPTNSFLETGHQQPDNIVAAKTLLYEKGYYNNSVDATHDPELLKSLTQYNEDLRSKLMSALEANIRKQAEGTSAGSVEQFNAAICFCGDRMRLFEKKGCASTLTKEPMSFGEELKQHLRCQKLLHELHGKDPACVCPLDLNYGTCGVPLTFDLYGKKKTNGVSIKLLDTCQNAVLDFKEAKIDGLPKKHVGWVRAALKRSSFTKKKDSVRWEGVIPMRFGEYVRKTCSDSKWSINVGDGAIAIGFQGLAISIGGRCVDGTEPGKSSRRRRLLGRHRIVGC